MLEQHLSLSTVGKSHSPTGKGKGKRPFLCLLLLMLFLLPCPGKEGEIVRVAVIDYPNFLTMREDGNVFGYAWEYLREIQKRTEWDIVPVEMSLPDSIQALMDGTIDLTAGGQYAADRTPYWDYSKRSMGEGGTVLCSMVGNNTYAYNDYTAYGGMRIGALKGSGKIALMEKKLAHYGVEATFVPYDTDEQSKQALRDGEVDTILMSTIRCEAAYKIIATVEGKQLFFCTNKQKPWLKEELDEAMDEIHLDYRHYEDELDKKYYGTIPVQSILTKKELEYVASAPPLTVAMTDDMAPVCSLDEETGKYMGLIPDMLNLMSEYSGLKFTFVPRQDAQTMNQLMEEGKLQMLDAVARDMPYITETLSINVTAPYYDNGVLLVTKEKEALDNDGLMILKKGYPLFEHLAKNHNYHNITYANSFEECIQAVERGNANFTLVFSNSREHLLGWRKETLDSYMFPESTYQFGFGVSSFASPLLLPILNKAISSIDDRERTQLLIQNIGYDDGEITLSDFLSKYRILFLGSAITILLLVILTILQNSRKINKLNRQLTTEVIRADKSSNAKSEFLSRMSHDIRTPLNAVLGFANLAKDTPSVPEETIGYLDEITSSGSYLLGLLNDVLDMSKIESGKMKLHEESVNLTSFLEECTDIFRSQAKEKGIALVTDFPNREIWLVLDRLRMRQIFSNLLSNAIKFSPQNTEIHWSVTAVGDDTAHLTCIVQDQGIGMSGEFMKKLFQPFEQGNPSNTEGGTGLGLSIVKNLVIMMGGTIQVESEPGKGSRFTVTLDRKKGTPQEKERNHKANLSSLKNRHILLAEDNSTNAMIATRMLEKKGCVIDVACNGKIAVEMAKKKGYDAILMDVRMPIMDGLEATRIIRQSDTEVPIIAMSANAFDDDIRIALGAGMNAYIPKPIDAEKLFVTLAQHMGKRQRANS